MDNKFKTIFFWLLVIGVIWYWQSSKEKPLSDNQNVTWAQIEGTTTAPTSAEKPTETSHQVVVEKNQKLIDQCIAEQDAKYWQIDDFIIRTCLNSGYSINDYKQGFCQLPYPDVNQTMLVRRQQHEMAQRACEQRYQSSN